MESSNNAAKSYKIAKNYIYSLIYQIFTIITPLITTPYISRVLGPTNIGIYGYVESICVYFIVIGNLGFPLLGQREIAFTSDNFEKRSFKFADIMLGKTFFLSVSLIAYIIFSIFFAKDNNIIFLSYSLGIVADLLHVGWFFQGIEDFKTTVVRNFIIKILSVASIFIFVKTPNDLLIYSIVINAANIIGNLFVVFALRKKVSLKGYKINVKRIVSLIKPALILAIPYYISALYAVIDKTMLGMICENYSEVGYYEQSQKIITFALAIVTALGAVFMPRMAKESENNEKDNVQYFLKKGVDAILLISVPIFAGLICVGDMMVPWFFGPGYDSVGTLIMTFSPIALFLGLNSFLGNQYLVSAKKEKLLTVTFLLGIIVNITSNAILIPFYDALGAAIATVASEFSKLLFLVICLRKTLKIKFIVLKMLKYVALTMPMFAFGMMAKKFIFTTFSISNTLILVLLCCIIYFFTLAITRNEIIMSFFTVIKNKLKKRKKQL